MYNNLESRQYTNVVDCIKGVCAICVIILHEDIMKKNDPFYILCAAQAVPVFMMISGYNFARGG